MPPDDEPKDPFTASEEAWAGMHELFTTLTAQGFTENQALKLIAYMLMGGRPDDEGS